MAENLSFGKFPLIPIASENDSDRPGSLILEYFQVSVTIGTNTGDVEVPTTLGEVVGVISLCYASTFDTGDALDSMTTDGVITSSAVTVRCKTTSISDGALTVRGFLVGKKSETVLSFS